MFRSTINRVAGVITRQLSTSKRCHLPVCTVETTMAHLPSDFSSKLSKLIATTLDKPEPLISVLLRTNVEIIRNGMSDPNAVVNIWSIGVFDEARNPKHSKVLMDFLCKELNIPYQKIALIFHPIEKYSAGHLLYAESLKGK